MNRAADIARALADRAEEVAVSLLGNPTSATAREMRWRRKGSLALRRSGERRGRWYDHERSEGGDLLHLVARERGVDIAEAIRIAEWDYLGGSAPAPSLPTPRPTSRPTDEAGRIAAAMRMWRATTALCGTLGERYFLEHRRLDVRHLDLDHALGWHAGQRCIVALMTDAVTGEPTGIHRTFLDPAGMKLTRKMLGRKGVIRLSPDDSVTLGLGLVEGVEDGLAVILSGWSPVWCAADAGAMSKFPVLGGIEALTAFADADSAGMNAARQCVARWIEAGREARISPPVRAAHA